MQRGWVQGIMSGFSPAISGWHVSTEGSYASRKPPSHNCLLLGSVSSGLGVVSNSLIIKRSHRAVPVVSLYSTYTFVNSHFVGKPLNYPNLHRTLVSWLRTQMTVIATKSNSRNRPSKWCSDIELHIQQRKKQDKREPGQAVASWPLGLAWNAVPV